MVTIESDKSEINAPALSVFTFLSDMNNWQSLMPKEVSKWESENNHCTFVLGGMATIGLRISELDSHSRIKLISEGKSPFSFDLQVTLAETSAEKCTVQLLFNGDMNMMMRMVAEKPLTNFFNYLSHKMKGIK